MILRKFWVCIHVKRCEYQERRHVLKAKRLPCHPPSLQEEANHAVSSPNPPVLFQERSALLHLAQGDGSANGFRPSNNNRSWINWYGQRWSLSSFVNGVEYLNSPASRWLLFFVFLPPSSSCPGFSCSSFPGRFTEAWVENFSIMNPSPTSQTLKWSVSRSKFV